MKYWKTKEGTKIAIKDMETSHIENCIKMLERIPNQTIDVIEAEEHGFNFTVSQAHEDAEKIESYIKSFRTELRLRKAGKPKGEDAPLPAIQKWETKNFRNES